MYKTIIMLTTVVVSSHADAGFSIDYQGLTKEPIKEVVNRVTPDGFQLIKGKFAGQVVEIGEGIPDEVAASGEQLELSDAMTFILPSDWFVYADETVDSFPKVTFDAVNTQWTHVLADISQRHGVSFIVDWDQKLIQVSRVSDFVDPQFNAPSVVTDPQTGKEVFIYTKDEKNIGHFLVDGDYIPVKLSTP